MPIASKLPEPARDPWTCLNPFREQYQYVRQRSARGPSWSICAARKTVADL